MLPVDPERNSWGVDSSEANRYLAPCVASADGAASRKARFQMVSSADESSVFRLTTVGAATLVSSNSLGDDDLDKVARPALSGRIAR